MSLRLNYSPMFSRGGGSSGLILPLSGICDASLEVGVCVYISGNTDNGKRFFSASSALDHSTLPSIGIVVSKPTATKCEVATYGTIQLPDSVPVLQVGKVAFVGIDGFAKTNLLTEVSGCLYLQRVGSASKPRELIIKFGEEIGIL